MGHAATPAIRTAAFGSDPMPGVSRPCEQNVTLDAAVRTTLLVVDCIRRCTMLGPLESAAVALLIVVPLFFVIRRSTMTYAPTATPSWWQIWR